MATAADDALKNVLLNGILKDLDETWKRKSHRATLILIYCGIDVMAHLTMPTKKAKVSRTDFVDWCDKYLRFRDSNGNRTLSVPGLELYAARCALVHTYGTEADLHKEGKVKRQIGYGDEFLPEVAASQEVAHLVMVSIRGLVDALSEGIIATLKDIAGNEPRRKVFAVRLEKMVHELPFNGRATRTATFCSENEGTPAMTRRQHLRRVGILCCHFLRNLAFYKAGWRKGELRFKGQFWVSVNSNFIDICVLEWYKLFGDKRGQHYWRKVITNQAAFFAGLLQAVGQTEVEFDSYVEEMRTYRDKFIAHLDSEEIMNIPKLRVARKSAAFLYEYLLSNEEVDNCFHDAPPKASRFYRHFCSQGRKVYSK